MPSHIVSSNAKNIENENLNHPFYLPHEVRGQVSQSPKWLTRIGKVLLSSHHDGLHNLRFVPVDGGNMLTTK
jgi:hypothetical protein